MSLAKWGIAAVLLAPPGIRAATAQVSNQKVMLHGVVVDQTGAAIPGADVTVYRDEVAVGHLRTDPSGNFNFSGVPREYRVVVRSKGFEELRSTSIPFDRAGVSRFTLVAGATAEGSRPVQDLRPNSPVQGRLQESAVHGQANAGPWELGAVFQGGLGLTENRESFRFLLAGAHLGKVLTPELGTGVLRGNFEYAGEFFPYWQSFTPRTQKLSCNADPGATAPYTCAGPYTVGGTYTGLSVTPIILRWNFTHGERWMPWVQGAGGVVWTNHKFPAIGNTNPLDLTSNGIHGDASVWNFTPQFGVGTHYFVRPRRSVDFSANAVHISSASLGDRNPGVNASVQFSVGYTWWK